MRFRDKSILPQIAIILLAAALPVCSLAETTYIGPANIAVQDDPAGHQEFINMPSLLDLKFESVPDLPGVYRLTGPAPWVQVVGTFVPELGEGHIVLSGTGTVAENPNISVTFDGTFISGQLDGTYTMGAAGGLPGGQPITYTVQGQLSSTTLVPTDCSFSLSHHRQVFPSAGGTGTVGVITQPGCVWTAISNNTLFIIVLSAASGTASGKVEYTVTQNFLATARGGTITIAGLTFTVGQAGTFPFFQLRPELLSLTFHQGATHIDEKQFTIFSSVDELLFTAMATTETGGPWLSVNPPSGPAPSSLIVSVNPSGLPVGTYQGSIAVTIPNAAPSTQLLPVTLEITEPPPTIAAVRPLHLNIPAVLDGAAQARRIGIFNLGGGQLDFQATPRTFPEGAWLTLEPASGTATLASPAAVAVTANPAGLAAGTYRGAVALSSSTTGQSIDIPVIMTVSGVQQLLRLSQRGLTFRSVAGGSAIPPGKRIGVRNTGRGVLNWTASASTVSGGNWLMVSPASGSTDAAAGSVPGVEVSVNPAGLAAGQYYGRVRVASPEVDNSPQIAAVVLNVLPAGSGPRPVVEPSGLVFTGIAGGTDPAPRTIRVSNLTDVSRGFISGRFPDTTFGWFIQTPARGTVGPNQPVQISIQPSIAGLTAGVRRGALTLAFDDGNVRTVEIVLVLADPGAIGQSFSTLSHLPGCTPATLHPAFTLLGNQFNVSAAWPVPVETTVVDNCGDPLTTGSVLLTFSNGDPPLPLQSLQDGRWSGTWQASNVGVSEVTITVTAAIPGTTVQGSAQIVGGVQANPAIPQVGSGGVVSAASFAAQVPASPGSLISIFGVEMADGTGAAQSFPLATQLAGTTVLLGGQTLPLLFSSAGQINAQVPYGIATNTEHQLVVQRGTSFTVPEPVTVADAQPAVFTLSQSGQGQGLVFVATATTSVLADASNPAKANDVVVIWCAGLGAVNPSAVAGSAAPSLPPATTVDTVTVSIGGVNAPVQFAGLASGFTGLYQVTAVVPAGVTPGNDVPVILSVSGQDSPPVTMAVQ